MNNKLIKSIIFTILLIIAMVVQGSFVKIFSFVTISPNILIVLISGIGFIRGTREGLLMGFLAGLMFDIYYGTNIGLYALLYMYIGYISGILGKIFVKDYLLMVMGIIAISDIIYNIIIYIFFFLLRGRYDFINYLLYTIIPETIFTIIISLILYKPLLSLNIFIDNRFKEREK